MQDAKGSAGIARKGFYGRTITLSDFHELCRLQTEGDIHKVVVVCPACGTAQSAADFEGLVQDPLNHLGKECYGRYTGAGSPRGRKNDGSPCNWAVYGFFQIHTLEILTPDGQHHPHFEVADMLTYTYYHEARVKAKKAA